mgnify:CR=1 FL=1
MVDDVRIKDGKVDDKKKVNELECEAIANFVYDAIKTAAESGCSPRSIGIISMAGAAQCKAIQECLERKIDSLRIELDDGPERIEQHNIICGEPAQFQGAERDIILLSVVRDASCIFKEIDPQRRKQWNVAMTRAMYKMILFRSFDIGDIQDKNDIKRDTFRFFISARRARELSRNSSPTQATLECCIEDDKMDQCKRVRTKIENRLVSTLESRGFSLVRKGGNIWAGALCVGNQGRPKTERALLCIENCGESKEEWIKLVEQQTTLERTGRACLRVDGISLALNFDASLAEILQYLKTAGLSVSVPLPSEKALPTTAPVAAIFTTREATDSSSGSSEVDSSTNNTKRKVSACSNSDYDTDGSSNGDNILLDSDTSSNADHKQPPAKPSVAAPTGRKSEVAASDKPGNEKSKARKRNPNSASAGPARRSTRQRTT